MRHIYVGTHPHGPLHAAQHARVCRGRGARALLQRARVRLKRVALQRGHEVARHRRRRELQRLRQLLAVLLVRRAAIKKLRIVRLGFGTS